MLEDADDNKHNKYGKNIFFPALIVHFFLEFPNLTQHEIANLHDITSYVKFRKAQLTALRRVNKIT